MSKIYGRLGPKHPVLAELGHRISLPISAAWASARGFHLERSRYTNELLTKAKAKFQQGHDLHLLAIGPMAHDTGAALVKCSVEEGIQLLSNNEEERYSGIKHSKDYPAHSIADILDQMNNHGIGIDDIDACVASFDAVRLASPRFILEEAPASFSLATYMADDFNAWDLIHPLISTAKRLGRQFEMRGLYPIVGLRHHDNHAYFSYLVSPFRLTDEPVMVAVLDALGDDGAMSLYLAKGSTLRLLTSNRSIFDSLGFLYGIISATQGGWTMLSSEGRYMGAVAWGNSDRHTNPYYGQLRELIHLGPDGEIFLNRELANWHRNHKKPYSSRLVEILGPPIPRENRWNPDAVLDVEDIRHAEITAERVDKAAATQMVFEDALFHVVGHLIRRTGSNKLVLTGGCALNCLASMRLLDHFDEAYFERYLGRKNTRLHLWVPPIPHDPGATSGAAFNMAVKAGATCSQPLTHAFYCGQAASHSDVINAIHSDREIGFIELGGLNGSVGRVGSLLAYLVARGGVIGLFQGRAETGPRALGHRSIVADPSNPNARRVLNELVKHREAIRPLAPMVTAREAPRWFKLSEGASDADFNAYNYMVLTAFARPETTRLLPGIVHKDGTSRLQIVRRETDPLTYSFLEALGSTIGAEVSINTSLNVGSPIVQTPRQALAALKRSRGMHGLIFVARQGETTLVWDKTVSPPKDGGETLLGWLESWKKETSSTFVKL